MIKLTKPQQALLDELKARKEMPVSSSYQPAQALVRLGLAELRQGRLGSDRLFLKEEAAQ